MAATVTLATTTFATTVQPGDTQVNLSSLTGIVPGIRLFVDRELMAVLQPTGIGNWVNVMRGRDGTETRRHATNVTVYIGRGDQFYEVDPQGMPPPVVLIAPHINVRTGVAWVAIGDEAGNGADARMWQPVTVTPSAGALGVRVVTTTTPT